MSCLVAYSDTPAGRDALSVAVRYADATGQDLDILVVRLTERSTPPLDGYTRLVGAVTQEWLAKAAARAGRVLPAERVHTHQVMADSVPEGLLATAAERGSSLLVVGGAGDGIRGRLAISALARVLLYSSPVPVALAPRRIRKLKLSGVSRISVGVGEAGPGPVLAHALGVADQARCPLRALTLVSGGETASQDLPTAMSTIAQSHTVAVSMENAAGGTVADALAAATWEPSEVLVLGSSRLGATGRIFLGATAGKILREVPVPVIVVPRSADTDDQIEGESS